MSKKESPQEIATKRFEIISPLLDPNLDADMFCATKNKIASASGVSYRTIGRWYKRYKENGFAGLEPKAPISKQPTSKLPANFSEIEYTGPKKPSVRSHGNRESGVWKPLFRLCVSWHAGTIIPENDGSHLPRSRYVGIWGQVSSSSLAR